MYCLKCGKETRSENVFCDGCLETMERYPIKPDTPVQLPRRQAASAAKKQTRRRILTQEEIIQRLKVTVRVLIACLLISCLTIGSLCWLCFFSPKETPVPVPENDVGKNYTVDVTNSR